MTRLRILLGEMPQMLREILEGALKLQVDMELLESTRGTEAADVVIVADRSRRGAAWSAQLLVDNPRLKLFVLSNEGREAHLLELRRSAVAEMSVQGLVDAIRAAARRDAADATRYGS